VKASPFKSLEEIDYSHPSVVFWFFGQAPPRTSKKASASSINNHSTSTRTSSDKGISPSTKESNGKTLHASPPLSGHVSPVHGSSTPLSTSPSANSHVGSPDEEPNLTKSVKDDQQKGKKPDNKRSKIIKELPPAPVEQRPGKQNLHPLANHPDITPLNDLQIFITEAIMNTEGGSASLEEIYQHVSKKWRSIRRRDGSNYTTDCRRAIQANLRHNPHHIPLFRRDENRNGFWKICATMDEALKERTALTDKKKEPSGAAEEASSDEDSKSGNNNNADDDTAETNSKSKNQKEVSDNENSHTDELPPLKSVKSEPQETSSTTASSDEKSDKKLSELQEIICECINDNGGSCHFDLIVHHVTKHWSKLKSGGSSDSKNAILAALTDAKRLFKRDNKRTGWWTINPAFKDLISHPSSSGSKEDVQVTSPRSRKRRAATLRDNGSDIKIEKNSRDNDNNSDDSDEEAEQKEPAETKEDSKKDLPMTGLQILIIEAIELNGGSATFDQIFEHVAKSFDNLRRRDGSPYTSDPKRAIQASLSNNPSSRPFFKKESKKGVSVWSLAKRSLDFWVDYKKKRDQGLIDPTTLSPLDDADSKKGEDSDKEEENGKEHSDNEGEQAENYAENDSYEEPEIKDSSESEYEHEKNKEASRQNKSDTEHNDNSDSKQDAEDSKNTDSQEERERSERQSLGNRQKRARRIKESHVTSASSAVGKRQLRETTIDQTTDIHTIRMII